MIPFLALRIFFANMQGLFPWKKKKTVLGNLWNKLSKRIAKDLPNKV